MNQQSSPKNILVSVYASELIGNCSNNGVTSKYKSFKLFKEVDDINEILEYISEKNMNIEECLIVKTLRGFNSTYIYCIPLSMLNKEHLLMNGGCFVYTTDSRFCNITCGSRQPIPVHDRIEYYG